MLLGYARPRGIKENTMKTIFWATPITTAGSAGTIFYNTLGSKLLSGGAVSCVQNTTTTLTLDDANGQITLTYVTATGLNVIPQRNRLRFR